jgi:hypothetical protein
MTEPSAPLSLQEKLTFGENARRHPITGYPLEQGMTDHGAGGDGKPPSDNLQAQRHFLLMVDKLQKMADAHAAESDPAAKARIRTNHQTEAVRVTGICEQLIDAGIVAKSALSWIPQI